MPNIIILIIYWGKEVITTYLNYKQFFKLFHSQVSIKLRDCKANLLKQNYGHQNLDLQIQEIPNEEEKMRLTFNQFVDKYQKPYQSDEAGNDGSLQHTFLSIFSPETLGHIVYIYMTNQVDVSNYYTFFRV